MIPHPNTHAVQSGDTVTRTPGVGVSTRRQAHRAMATVAEILGRDPKRDDVFVGGTGLIQRRPNKSVAP